MKISLLLFVLVSTVAKLTGASGLNKGDVTNVWAIQGLPLYANAGIPGKTLTTLAYGSSVTVIDDNISLKPFSVNQQNLVLKGEWVKVRYKGLEGYVFSGNLSKMVCFKKIGRNFEPEEAYLKRNFGRPKITSNKIKSAKTITKTYKNGVTEIETLVNKCKDVQLYLTNTSYHDVLLFQQVSLHDMDGADHIKVKDLKSGKIELSYTFCH